MAETQDDSQTGGDNQPEIQLTPENEMGTSPDVAAGAAPAPDVAAGAAPAPDVAAGAAPAPARTDMTVAEMRAVAAQLDRRRHRPVRRHHQRLDGDGGAGPVVT